MSASLAAASPPEFPVPRRRLKRSATVAGMTEPRGFIPVVVDSNIMPASASDSLWAFTTVSTGAVIGASPRWRILRKASLSQVL